MHDVLLVCMCIYDLLFNYCYHLAAISQVLTSNTSPEETFQINIFGKFFGQIRAHVCEDFAGKQE